MKMKSRLQDIIKEYTDELSHESDCSAEDIIIPYGSSGARTAERVSHIMRKTKNDIKKLQVAGFYKGQQVVRYTTVTSTRFDVKRAKEILPPQVLDVLQVQSNSRRFTLVNQDQQ